ncbi:hypothetical protein [Flavihumibacter petaseus]|uniref:Uncharacterized protein n=1 Tax=Flavihumibacter petaseus NBRC 106054 TaxID=1220578 RepID=A0A0E9N4L1_9BACT|nr:hypothetical protein [Flavihumibacter petaseus]GAO44305.1 hypothetical protein FPE01S_03_03430 [Flavihumibacter petaseus NBRC 106054]
MDTTTMLLIAFGLLVIIAGLYFFFYMKDKKTENKAAGAAPDQLNAKQLKLQAYERLVILAERIALPNLISRSNEPGLNLRDMQALLTQTIRQEYDYNLSQQIYVSNEAWEAVRSLKEQNIHIINQIASIMPPETTGPELNRKIVEFIMNQPQGSMHSLVQEALSHEARKLMA